jgi:hypothetical protein
MSAKFYSLFDIFMSLEMIVCVLPVIAWAYQLAHRTYSVELV